MKGQNTSTAVMQRRSEPHDSLDDFPTPPWATRAMLHHVMPHTIDELRTLTAWEPACNRGYMARPLSEYFACVQCTDIHDYGWDGQACVQDFLWPGCHDPKADWIITNPPFRLADQFIKTGLERARIGVAVLLRVAFLEGKDRYTNLFSLHPPSIVAQYVERVAMVRGKIDAEASSATAYAWFIWQHGNTDTRLRWIPPSRQGFERPDDYPTGAVIEPEPMPLFEGES